MSVYLMLTTLTDTGRKALQDDPELLKEINKTHKKIYKTHNKIKNTKETCHSNEKSLLDYLSLQIIFINFLSPFSR